MTDWVPEKGEIVQRPFNGSWQDVIVLGPGPELCHIRTPNDCTGNVPTSTLRPAQ